jgi:peptidoglycan/LPS O-acetylase OafA/YrhL
MNADPLRPKIPALTSLRFFAALHVLLFHTRAMGAVFGPLWFQRLSSIGYTGVSLFFVLSGFILVYTYSGRSVTPQKFWSARFARVYPAYAFALLLTLPIFLYSVTHFREMGLPFGAFQASHAKIAAGLEILLLQSWVPPAALSWNAVGWSLSVEAFFYLLFPFLLTRFERLSKTQLFFTIALCWIVSNAISGSYVWFRPDGVVNPDANVYTSWMNLVKFFPLARLPEFLMGMSAGILFLRSSRSPRLAAPLVLGGAIAVALVSAFSNRLPYAVIHTALLSPAFVAIVYGIALRPKWATILEFKLPVLLGDSSYSMYLIHASFVFPLFHTSTGTVRNANFSGLALCLGIVLLFSMLIYRFIEEPARRKLRPKTKPEPQWETKAAAAAAGR